MLSKKSIVSLIFAFLFAAFAAYPNILGSYFLNITKDKKAIENSTSYQLKGHTGCPSCSLGFRTQDLQVILPQRVQIDQSFSAKLLFDPIVKTKNLK